MLSGKLAACVNIIPGITSVYEWQGKVIDTVFIIVNLPSHFFVSSIGFFFGGGRVKNCKNHLISFAKISKNMISKIQQKYLKYFSGGVFNNTHYCYVTR